MFIKDLDNIDIFRWKKFIFTKFHSNKKTYNFIKFFNINEKT